MFQIVGYDVLLLLVMRENGGSEGRSGEGKFFYMDYVWKKRRDGIKMLWY